MEEAKPTINLRLLHQNAAARVGEANRLCFRSLVVLYRRRWWMEHSNWLRLFLWFELRCYWSSRSSCDSHRRIFYWPIGSCNAAILSCLEFLLPASGSSRRCVWSTSAGSKVAAHSRICMHGKESSCRLLFAIIIRENIVALQRGVHTLCWHCRLFPWVWMTATPTAAIKARSKWSLTNQTSFHGNSTTC